MIITDVKWLKKIVEFACFPVRRKNWNDFSVVDRLSTVTSGRIGPLFARCNHSKQSIYFSRNDFLILLALFWCQTNPSFITKIRVRFAYIFWRSQVKCYSLSLDFKYLVLLVSYIPLQIKCFTFQNRLTPLLTQGLQLYLKPSSYWPTYLQCATG